MEQSRLNSQAEATPSPHGCRVFVSYRRDDAADATDRLADALRDRLGPDRVFVDIDNVEPGDDFPRVVEEWVASCDALVAVIGRNWVDARDRTGRRRIDDPDDFVRLEIEAGLRSGVRVFPVLLHGAQMPSREELPDSLLALRRRNAVQIDRKNWRYDVGRLLTALEFITPAEPRPMPGPIQSDLSIGAVIGGCRIEAEIGSGGMAVVYRATELALGRTVAVKVISPSLAANPEFQRRFRREARAASMIDHEHVIAVHRFSVDERPAYIVMRYVDGPNLSEILKARGPLDPEPAVDVIEQVASALDVLHEHDIVHRDVKPANIIVENATSHVFLADFGLAKPLADDELGQTTLMGTELYMAPERERGDETKLGDVYSLGCVLRELLMGLGSLLPGRAAEVESADVPAALSAVVRRALREEPRERFPSAGELARAAREALHSRQQSAGGASPARHVAIDQPFHDVLSVDLSKQVADLCQGFMATISDPGARREVEAIVALLGQPLVLAVVGDEGAGKSTLINALLGRRILSKMRGETQVPTLLRFGTTESLDLVLRDGTRQSRRLQPGELIPNSITDPPPDLETIEISLSVELLRSLTFVDAPLDTHAPADRDDSSDAVTRVRQPTAIPITDALLLVLRADTLAENGDAFAALRRSIAAHGGATSLNTIGALTRIDPLISEGGWEAAGEQAGRLRKALGSMVGTVVPVAGLLAEVADTHALTEADAVGLAQLAGLGQARQAELLASTTAFCSEPAPVSSADRVRLSQLLGRYGIRSAFELADAAPLNSVALARRMRELSGIAALRRQIDGLQLRADALKADAALRKLETLSWKQAGLADLRDQIDELRLNGKDMHLLELIGVFNRCVTHEIELGPGMLAELERLLTARDARQRLGVGPNADPREMGAVAARRARSWKSYQNGGLASVQAARVADKVVRFYDNLSFSA
jgi:predicted Ser/Thr protein kinase